MNAELSELRDSARQVLAAEGLAAPEDKTWPLALDLGWLLVAVPEAQGGLGQGLAGACAFHAEMGRSLCAAPYLPAMLAMEAVIHTAREDWIERLGASGFVTAPLVDPTLTITDGGIVAGMASAVPSADRASHVLLGSEAGDCVALVALQQAGIDARHRETWDTTRRLFDLRFDNVAVDPSLVLDSTVISSAAAAPPTASAASAKSRCVAKRRLSTRASLPRASTSDGSTATLSKRRSNSRRVVSQVSR